MFFFRNCFICHMVCCCWWLCMAWSNQFDRWVHKLERNLSQKCIKLHHNVTLWWLEMDGCQFSRGISQTLWGISRSIRKEQHQYMWLNEWSSHSASIFDDLLVRQQLLMKRNWVRGVDSKVTLQSEFIHSQKEKLCRFSTYIEIFMFCT